MNTKQKIWVVFLWLMSLPSIAQPMQTANVWLVTEGKHANIIFLAKDAAPVLPVEIDPADGPYVMLSWGDAAFYQSAEKNIALTLRALLLPTQAAINVRVLEHLHEAPQTTGKAKLYEFHVKPRHVTRMLNTVKQALLQDGPGQHSHVTHLGKNDWVGGDFYAAHDRRYSIFYTCNNWIGGVLKSGGLPFTASITQLAPTLVGQHKLAWIVSSSHRAQSRFRSRLVESASASDTSNVKPL